MTHSRKSLLGDGKNIARPAWSLARMVVPPVIEGLLVGIFIRELYRHALETTSIELAARKTDIERLVQKIGNALTLGVSLEETLDRIIDLALSIINVEHGMVALLEHDTLRVVSSIGIDICPPSISVEGTAAGRALAGKRPVIIEDLRLSPHIASSARSIKDLRSVLAAPIIIDNQGIGVIEVYAALPRAFTDDDAGVLFAFAKQASVAIRNARSVIDLKAEADFRRTLSVIAESLLAAPDLDSLLFQLCEEATKAFNIDGTYIWRVEPKNKRLVAFAAYGYRSELFMGRTLSLDAPQSMAVRAAQRRQTVTANNIDLKTRHGELFETFQPRSQAAIPITLDDNVAAIMILNDRSSPYRFDESTTRKAEILAGQAALAIANAGLIERLSTAEQVLTSTFNSVTEGIIMVGENLDILFINGAASHIFGVELSHFAGTASRADIAPLLSQKMRDVQRYEQEIACLYSDMERELMDEFETTDGKVLQCFSRPVYRGDVLLGRIEVYRDVTSAKLAQRELALRAKRSRAIAEIGRAASSSLEVEEVLRTVVSQTCQVLDADKGSFFLYDSASETIAGQVGYNFRDEDVRAIVQPVAPGEIAFEAFSGREPIALEYAERDSRVPADYVEKFSVRSILAIPLFIRERTIGLIMVCITRGRRRFSEEEVAFANGIAAQASVAIENARLFETERGISKTLQQSLLPSATPEVPGLDIGICYISSTEAALVGGDFYDFLTLPDGRLGFVIGDVSGKGIGSAQLTATIKQSIRAFAYEDPKPARVMGRTNRATMWQMERGHFVTAFYAIYDPKSQTVEYANAGHPHPIVVFDGHVETMTGSGMALGIREQERYRTYTQAFEPGYLLALYTDGVTEARRDSDFFGDKRLTEALVETAGFSAQALVDRTIDGVKAYAKDHLTDDIALMVLKRV